MSTQSSHSVPSRNPRRRQRNDSEDRSTLSVRQPQRKRSKLSEETFNAPVNGEPTDEGKENIPNGHAVLGDQDRSSSGSGTEIPVRGKPSSPPSKRNTKDEGAAILTKNVNYMVKQLPSLPEQLRTLKPGYYRASARPSIGLSLAVTRDHVYVWDYNSTLAIPPNRVFPLPHPSRDGEPLSFASFSSNGSTSEVGLVVVSPSGRVCFWENIENADALSLFEQRRNGIQGSIGNLSAGERIIKIEPAQHAGFIVILSSGRVAQLLVRDAQSRPSINVKFLKGQKDGGGIFGGIRSALTGAGWLKNVVSAKSRMSPTTRGVVDLIIGNDGGQFQLWQLDWAGRATFEGDINAKDVLTDAAKATFADRQDVDDLQVTVADFSLSPRADVETDNSFRLTLLLAVASPGFSTFAVAEVDLEDRIPNIKRLIELSSYPSPTTPTSQWQPKLCLPKYSRTAFIVFERAITLISLAAPHSGPNSQILMDDDRLPTPFQDTIYFRDEKDIQVLGAEAESLQDRNRSPSTLLFVQGFGAVRVTSFEPKTDMDAIERSRVSAKSKIEQAVFYGTKISNPLNLAKKSEIPYSVAEIEGAALEISREIVESKSAFIPVVTTSMEYHLNLRANALQYLASHIKYTYPGTSREVRWKLRWDAEKIAAAKKIWGLYDKSKKEDPKRMKLLPEIIDYLPDDVKTPAPLSNVSDFDWARHYFIHDLSTLENVIGWARNGIEELEKDKQIPDTKTMLNFISDAIDLLVGGLEAAFVFRQENAWQYDLEDEVCIDGVLRSDYNDLEEFWTSSQTITAEAVQLTKGARNAALKASEKEQDTQLAAKIGSQLGRLVRICCLCYEERYRNSLGSALEQGQAYAKRTRERYLKERPELIKMLASVGLVEEGMRIAEVYGDMDALVELLREKSSDIADLKKEGTPIEKKRADAEMEALEDRVHEYFKKFGTVWGDAYFSTYVQKGSLAGLLDQGNAYDAEIRRFLNADPSRKKLSWINEVAAHKNYKPAGNALLEVAVSQEEDLWSKKVELSLAKLSFLAADERQNPRSSLNSKTTSLAGSRVPSRVATPDPTSNSLSAPAWNDIPADIPLPAEMSSSQTNKDLLISSNTLIVLQEALYAHVRPSVLGAMDEIASLQLAMGAFGTVRTAHQPALQQLLERGLESLLKQHVMSPDSLIDVLTLMDSKACEDPRDDISGTEFARALLVLLNSGLEKIDKPHFDLLLRTVWRRAFIADDWEEVNSSSAGQSDEQMTAELERSLLFKTVLSGRRAGFLPSPMSNTISNKTAPTLPPPPTPSAVLAAGTTPSEHTSRFQDPSLCEPIARDNVHEDDVLQKYINDFGLENWARTIGDWVENVLVAGDEEEGDVGSKGKRAGDRKEDAKEGLEALEGEAVAAARRLARARDGEEEGEADGDGAEADDEESQSEVLEGMEEDDGDDE